MPSTDHLPPPLRLHQEDLPDAVITLIRGATQRLTVAEWTNRTTPRTITEAIADLETGYAVHDMPPEKLCEASIAAGTLRAFATVHRCSIAELLAAIHVHDELVCETADDRDENRADCTGDADRTKALTKEQALFTLRKAHADFLRNAPLTDEERRRRPGGALWSKSAPDWVYYPAEDTVRETSKEA